MTGKPRPRTGRVIAAAAAVALAALALWGRWRENHLYRQAEALTGVGSPVLPGAVTPARSKIDPGRTGQQVVDAIGNPSSSSRTEGSSTHDIWIYYYADGTMTVNLTDGIVKRIAVVFGPPRIPISRRPQSLLDRLGEQRP